MIFVYIYSSYLLMLFACLGILSRRVSLPEMSREGLENCHPDDVSWLSSLSEAELDLLVHIKNLVIQRAAVIDGESLIRKFDLRMLRAIGTILMEYVRERLKETSLFGPEEISLAFNRCNLTAICKEEGTEDMNSQSWGNFRE